MSKKKFLVLLMSLVFIGLVAGVTYLVLESQKSEEKESENRAETSERPDLSNYQFAEYDLVDAKVVPDLTEYKVESDLSNVYYTKQDDPTYGDFARIDEELSSAQKQAIASDLFIITEGENKEFFSVYEQNRYTYTPSFITTDSVLHTYHLIFDSTLKQLETDYLASETEELAKAMVAKSQAQYESTTSEELKTAAKRNIAYFSVAAKLIDPDFSVPELVKTEVNQELALIEAHSETAKMSPVMAMGFDNPNDLDNLKEDYTQYIPRGHYTKSETLKRYFKSMMWMGRITFLTKDQTNSDSAFLIADILREEPDLYTQWENISAPITFFVGKSDDLGIYEFQEILDSVLPSTQVVDANETELAALWDAAKALEAPQLNSIPIYDETIQPDREAETKGFRFFGQRFTLDANVFQNLIYRSVKATDGGEKKMLPSFIEIPASLGDEVATEIVQTDTDYYDYPNYEEQVNKLKDDFDAMSEDEWTWNLYSSWLYTLNSQIGDVAEGSPAFMQTEKWAKKELNTYAGSWTELKHDTILYSKQVYAELGDMGPTETPDAKGYVEPNVVLWDRLQALVVMTKEGLLARNIISQTDETEGCAVIEDYKEKIYCNLSGMEESVLQLHDISVKELEGTALTEEEYEFIEFFGGDLESMFMATLEPGATAMSALDDNPAMLVADVATDPNGFALEEATGYINYIYVIVPVEGELRIARGGVYSQYEFVNESSDRLTDEAWREMLEDGDVPEMQPWQKSLITE